MSRGSPCAAALLVLACSACVPDRAYRAGKSALHEELTPRQFDPTQSALDHAWRYRLAFIEFNDRGEMFDPDELVLARKEIADARREATGRQAVMVAFVHGWKNNTSDSSGNVWGFRQVLAHLSLQYSPAPVVGVYIGWRGATVSAPIIEEFTFFDRHRRSQKVTRPQMPAAFRALMQEAQVEDKTHPDPPAISVFVGHSFGGAVLEDTVSEDLANEVVAARQERRDVRWPADLIILLNEAQEAERSYPLIDTMVENIAPRPACAPPGQKADYQRPAIISISSTGDYATRALFPGAQVPARLVSAPSYKGPDSLNVGSATPLFFGTTAHTTAFRSHLIGRIDDPAIVEAAKLCTPYLDFILPTGSTDIHYLMVERPSPEKNRSPYWVMHMPTSIVPDHSTIFTQVFRDFLVTLIQQSLFNPPQSTTLHIEK